MNDNEPPGLRDRLQNRVVIDGREGRDVDDFAAHAATLELLRGFQRLERHGAPGDERHVGAFAQLEADIERESLAVVRDFLFHQAIQADGLQEHDRVRVADGPEQQSISACG